MPTIEELTKQVKELTGAIAPLKADSAELKALRAKPDFSGLHRSEDGMVEGGWSEAEEITIVNNVDGRYQNGAKLERPNFRKAMKSLVRQGYRPHSEFKSLGEFYKFGIENRGEKTKIHDKLSSQYKAIQGMTTTDGADGGFTVMPEFNHQIFERTFQNNLWSMTDGYTVGGNNMTFFANAETSRANGSRHGGLQGYWMAEGGSITKSKPTLREVNLKLGKVAVVVYLTNEIVSDTANALEQYVTRKVSDEFAFLQGDSLFNGINVGGQPLGWLNAPNLISVAKEPGQEAATINTFNVQKMYARFFAPMRGNAQWFNHQDTSAQLNTMTLGLGLGQVPVYLPPGGMSSSPYGSLMGLPVLNTEFNATVGTQGDLMLCDMSQMLSITKGGVSQAVSMHVEFLTDQLAMRFTMRCAAHPWESTPLTPYKGSNTQSSCIVLDTRA